MWNPQKESQNKKNASQDTKSSRAVKSGGYELTKQEERGKRYIKNEGGGVRAKSKGSERECFFPTYLLRRTIQGRVPEGGDARTLKVE